MGEGARRLLTAWSFADALLVRIRTVTPSCLLSRFGGWSSMPSILLIPRPRRAGAANGSGVEGARCVALGAVRHAVWDEEVLDHAAVSHGVDARGGSLRAL